MTWCAAARSLHMPAIDLGALHNRATLAVGIGVVSMAGFSLWRSSSSFSLRSKPFACLGISTSASEFFLLQENENNVEGELRKRFSAAVPVLSVVKISAVLGWIEQLACLVFVRSLRTVNNINTGFDGEFKRVKEAVMTDKAPAALGPYSQAIKANNLVFVSGVLGLIPEVCDIAMSYREVHLRECRGPNRADAEDCTLGVLELLPTKGKEERNCLDAFRVIKLLKNMGEILKLSGANYFPQLADLNDFKKVNEIYAKYFPSPAPARSTYQVAALPLNARIEIECIAAL
ncbi:hypothetical protein C3L33_11580, partial [Rhododendron williamsianum]